VVLLLARRSITTPFTRDALRGIQTSCACECLLKGDNLEIAYLRGMKRNQVMWVKKTPAEQATSEIRNKRIQLRAAMIYPAVLILIVTIIYTFTYPRLGSIRNGGAFLVPQNQWLTQLPSAFIVGVLIGVGTFVMMLYPKKSPKITLICPECGAVKVDDEITSCSCSGHFVDIKTMKWVEDEPPLRP